MDKMRNDIQMLPLFLYSRDIENIRAYNSLLQRWHRDLFDLQRAITGCFKKNLYSVLVNKYEVNAPLSRRQNSGFHRASVRHQEKHIEVLSLESS